jgi:ABC-type transporter Mla MlaB component
MKREIVTKRDWDIMVGALDGDTQLALAETLAEWTGQNNVEYTANSMGRVDSASSPRYTDDPVTA